MSKVFKYAVAYGMLLVDLGLSAWLFMGNVPPLDVGVRGTPDEVSAWARTCLDKAAPGGGMILSFGGGVSPGTPPENVDALLSAAREWLASDEGKRRCDNDPSKMASAP